MAMQTTFNHCPEYMSFQENFEALVSTFRAQPAAYADSLFSNGYTPDAVLEYTRLNGALDSEKSRKILDTIIHRIEHNPSVFHGFIAAIAGPSTDDVVKKLLDSYERHKTVTSHVEQPQLSRPSHQQPPPEAPKSLSFPSLDTSSLDEDDRLELEEHLKADTRKMVTRFAAFTLIIKRSFENQHIPLEMIKDSVLSLEAFNDNIGVKVLDPDDKQKIEDAKTLSEVFITLRNYISFFNYEIVQYLIDLLGSPDDQKQLCEYCSALNQFCQRNVFEVPGEVFSSKSRSQIAVFVLKCTEHYATLEYVQGLKWRIAQTLGLRAAALQLCSVKKGCVELHLLISTAAAKRIFPVSTTVQAALLEMGVKILTCGSTDQLLEQNLSMLKLECGDKVKTSKDKKMATFTQPESKTDTNISTALKRESQLKAADTHGLETTHQIVNQRKLGRVISGVNRPSGVATNSNGQIVVIEMDHPQISVFETDGVKVQSFGTKGTSKGLFVFPVGVVVDTKDNIYVFDQHNRCIQKFSPEGHFLSSVDSVGSGRLSLRHSTSLAYNKNKDLIYVSVISKIQVFTSDLFFHKTFQTGSFYPNCLCCDDSGYVYMANSNQVQVFTAEGEFVRKFGSSEKHPSEKHPGQRSFLKGFAVNDGVLYTYSSNGLVSMFTVAGDIVGSFDVQGCNGFVPHWTRKAIAVNSNGTIFLVDFGYNRILIFSPVDVPVSFT